MKELGIGEGIIAIYSDSQSSLHLCKNLVYDHTKHIDVWFHFIRHMVVEGCVKLLKINTSENPSGNKSYNPWEVKLCLDFSQSLFKCFVGTEQ